MAKCGPNAGDMPQNADFPRPFPLSIPGLRRVHTGSTLRSKNLSGLIASQEKAFCGWREPHPVFVDIVSTLAFMWANVVQGLTKAQACRRGYWGIFLARQASTPPAACTYTIHPSYIQQRTVR